jgi:uncharacterized protein (TIGR02246 family)
MRKMIVPLFLLILTSSLSAESGDQDEAAIRQLIPSFTEAWARADAQAIAWLFAPDGDLIIPTGNVVSGRATIGGFYASVFAGGYRGSKGTGEIVRMRLLRPDVAVGDGTWSITGAHDKQGKETAPEQGVFTFVAVKQDGKWRISALREQTSATSLITSGQ